MWACIHYSLWPGFTLAVHWVETGFLSHDCPVVVGFQPASVLVLAAGWAGLVQPASVRCETVAA